MKYYIIKPTNNKIDENIINGIKELDKNAEIVYTLEDCDIVVLQKGWTRSKNACDERNRAYFELKKPCKEAHIYLTYETIHLN